MIHCFFVDKNSYKLKMDKKLRPVKERKSVRSSQTLPSEKAVDVSQVSLVPGQIL